ncbi:hypothetical protein LTR08_002375 [Meristemomyces frigidus]|nr:hypothetical protein LTR08_002375 [Meristemomyces frigidus]
MADDYEYDDGAYDFDDNWLYMEDDSGLADELAETQVPDPGYAGTQHEVEMETYEYDYFQYWDDLEYADDAYWEHGGGQKPRQEGAKAGQKRKRAGAVKAGAVDKRRKVSGTQTASVGALEASQPDNVVFMSREGRTSRAWRLPPLLEDRRAVAFLADWREHFAGKDGEVKTETMPVDMQQAALATDEGTPEKGRATGAMLVAEKEGDWEDEDAQDGVEVNPEDALAALDPDMLKAILRQKLGEAGLEGMDQGAFMASLGRMLAGDEDQAAGDLADTLLGQATTGSGSAALNAWLSQQGVSLPPTEGECDDDASSVATVELPPSSRRVGLRLRGSASDSAGTVYGGEIKEMAMHTASSTQMRQRSPLAAPTTTMTRQRNGKGKRVTFDVPASSSSRGDGRDAGSAAFTAEGLLSSEPVASEEDTGLLVSEPTLATPNVRVRATRSRGTERSGAANGGFLVVKAEDQLQEELEGSLMVEEEASAAAAPEMGGPKTTRKRKVGDEGVGAGDDEGGGGQRAGKEPATRRTRGARARAGAGK